MKIRRVKWLNHPILGNLVLDFVNPVTDKPYDTIVLVGENGTGKTTVFDTLNQFLSNGSFSSFEYLDYESGGLIRHVIHSPTNEEIIIQADIYDDRDLTNDIRYRTLSPIDQNEIEKHKYDPRYNGSVFSRARADYKTAQIRTTTTRKLDETKYDSDQNDDFTSLKQLLIDVYCQDCLDYASINQHSKRRTVSWNRYYLSSRFYRFEEAFNHFFDNLQFYRVEDSPNDKQLIFKKNDINIPIDKLSTGEKQIVYRGAYLLRNSHMLVGGTVFVDEPELSMHPKWEFKALSYYQSLFRDNTTGKLLSQLFFATHSEHILDSALLDKDGTLVILLQNLNGEIKSERVVAPFVLHSITDAEINFFAFDIVSDVFHNQLFGELQRKDNQFSSVTGCDRFIYESSYFDSAKHSSPYSNSRSKYKTICSFIRNAIDHPTNGDVFTEQQLRESIDLLIKVIKDWDENHLA